MFQLAFKYVVLYEVIVTALTTTKFATFKNVEFEYIIFPSVVIEVN
jgi:hypothetical protein